jgi:hypothetical protein
MSIGSPLRFFECSEACRSAVPQHASSVRGTGGSPSFQHGTDFSFLLCEREAKMNFFKRPSSANIPDNGEQERFLMGRVFVPLSEITTENDACAKPAPIDTHEVVPAGEANSDIPQLEHIVTDPHVSTTPGDEASIPPSKASKKTSLFGGKGIVICAMLSLATGIAVGAAWSRTHIFADSSKGQPAAQVAPAAAVVTAPNFNEIQNQLNAIARGLSSVQQHINELATGQEEIRKTQGQLAVLQARLVNAQTVANAKQDKQPAPAATEGRKFYRRDYR